MFTGIIKEIGSCLNISKGRQSHEISVSSKEIIKDLKIGDSVSVNGVCLTVTKKKEEIISFDIMEETFRKSTLGCLKIGDIVNLELALKSQDPIGGHFVLGHIDCIGNINSIQKRANDVSFEINAPDEFKDLIVEKGSVALDGVSLTVAETNGANFKVYLIPHTLKTTTLSKKKPHDAVNIEFDILGKYALKRKGSDKKSRLDENFLKEKGF